VRKERHPAQSLSLLSISVRPAGTSFRVPNGYGLRPPSVGARSRPGSRPSGGFVAHLAFDHQMTPTLFRPLFRASRSRGLHWRIGCRARLRRPSDLKHHAACREGCGLGSSFGPRQPDAFFLAHHAAPDCGEGKGGLRAEQRLAPLERWATGIACTAGLKHHAACREGCGLGSSFGPRQPDAFFLAHHAAPDFGEGKLSVGRNCA